MLDVSDVPLKIIFKSTLRASCDDVAMMLQAVGITSEMQGLEGCYAIVVQEQDVSRAAAQLRL